MEPLLRDLARSLAGTHTLEDLTRTLLAILGSITDLDSVYLTRIHEERLTQEVLFATNRQPARIDIPEGLSAPWQDTVCRRAIETATPVTQHADELWGDLAAVRELNIRTYVSEPVRVADGELVGTLCAVSDRRVDIEPDTLHVINLFARLIAHQYEREQQLTRLRQENTDLASRLTVDPLTGVANRRGLLDDLARALAQSARGGGGVMVAFVDLDRFKAINDLYGHRVGDHFLMAMAARLAAATRAGELVARYGGDEFVVVARTPGETAASVGIGGGPEPFGERIARATRGRFVLAETVIDYAGASVGVAVSTPGEAAEALLARADVAMFAVKKAAGRARSAAAPVAAGPGPERSGTQPADAG